MGISGHRPSTHRLLPRWTLSHYGEPVWDAGAAGHRLPPSPAKSYQSRTRGYLAPFTAPSFGPPTGPDGPGSTRSPCPRGRCGELGNTLNRHMNHSPWRGKRMWTTLRDLYPKQRWGWQEHWWSAETAGHQRQVWESASSHRTQPQSGKPEYPRSPHLRRPPHISCGQVPVGRTVATYMVLRGGAPVARFWWDVSNMGGLVWCARCAQRCRPEGGLPSHGCRTGGYPTMAGGALEQTAVTLPLPCPHQH